MLSVKDRTLAAGTLNQRVTIEQPTESVDSYGEATQSWATIPGGAVWASIDTGGGREFYRAQQTQADLTHLVTIRYRDDVTNKMRLKFGTRYLNIVRVVNAGEENVKLELQCVEAVN